MQNKLTEKIPIKDWDKLISALNGSAGFDADGTLPELGDGESTDPLMVVGNDGKAKKIGVKTLFGNKNIRGSGNIDLYMHRLTFTDTSGYLSNCHLVIYSSNNLNCDSLTDLKTLLGNTFILPCSGLGQSGPDAYWTVYCIHYSTGILTSRGGSDNIPWDEITVTDTVTTI